MTTNSVSEKKRVSRPLMNSIICNMAPLKHISTILIAFKTRHSENTSQIAAREKTCFQKHNIFQIPTSLATLKLHGTKLTLQTYSVNDIVINSTKR